MQRHGHVRWSPAGNLVAVSSGSEPLLVDVAGPAPGPLVPGTDFEIVFDVAWAPDGRSFYVVGIGGVYQLPAAAGQPLATLTDPAMRVWRSVAIAPDGRVAVAARSNDGEDVIRIHSPDLTTPGPEFEISEDRSIATAMRFSPDGQRIAIGFQHGPVGVWEVTGVQSRLAGSYHGHPRPGDGAYGLAWQPGTDRIASLDADGSIHLWRLRA
jgi:WD40 repeat protein